MNKKFIFNCLLGLCINGSYAQINFTEDSIYVLESYQYVDVGDLNNVTRDDIVLGTIDYNIDGIFPDSLEQVLEVYHQTDSNTFALFQRFKYDTTFSGNSLTSIEIADMNNDSLKDIIISFANTIAIYSQDTSFNFHLAYQFMEPVGGIQQIEVVKLSPQDTIESIIISYKVKNYMLILKPTSFFTFDTLTLYPPATDLKDFAIGDFNSDNLLDIAAITIQFPGNNPAYIFYQDSVNGFSSNAISLDTVFPFSMCNGIGAGDLNNDQLTDIIATFGGNSNHYIGIFFQDTTNQTVKYLLDTISCTVDIPSEILVRDLNNDGLNDLTVLHNGWSTLSVFEQLSNGGGIVHASSYFDFQGSTHIDSYAFIDLNGDDKIDIISVAAGEIKFYYNTSSISTVKPIEINKGFNFSVFPNPCTENCWLEIHESNCDNCLFFIYNSIGQIILSEKISSGIIKIDGTRLENGLYFYQIHKNKTQIISGKFIVDN